MKSFPHFLKAFSLASTFVLSSLSILASAQAANLSCPGSEIVSYVLIDEESDLHCWDVAEFLKIFDDVQSISPAKIHLNQLFIVPPGNNTVIQYEPIRSSLRIVGRSRSTSNKESLDARWLSKSKMVLPHEIGHMVFESLISEKFPMMKKLTTLQAADSNLLKCKRERPTANCEETLQLFNLSAKWNAFYAENNADILRLFGAAKPYHELFADLVSSLYFEDSEVTAKVLDGFNNTTTNACRSFTFNTPPHFVAMSEHCTLSAIRYDLWEALGLFKKKPWPKTQILSHVAKILISEIEYLMANPKITLTQEQANARLRTAFQLPPIGKSN